jgi:hypothetical protein
MARTLRQAARARWCLRAARAASSPRRRVGDCWTTRRASAWPTSVCVCARACARPQRLSIAYLPRTQGHCHPRLVGAAQKQLERLWHGQVGVGCALVPVGSPLVAEQVNLGFHEEMLGLMKDMLPSMPGSGDSKLDTFFFWCGARARRSAAGGVRAGPCRNSGAEAVEAAVKLARYATGRQNIIAMQGGYHGRTFGAFACAESSAAVPTDCGRRRHDGAHELKNRLQGPDGPAHAGCHICTVPLLQAGRRCAGPRPSRAGPTALLTASAPCADGIRGEREDGG